MSQVPPYLRAYEERYEANPREAALEWFEEAHYGLFLHYGLYSLLGNHEWVQYNETIPPEEYALLQQYFTAEHFDAQAIVQFAVDCGMRYVNLTSRHHEGFCLFDSARTNFTSVEAPAGRDLVGELANACHEAGLGLFLYYSHGYDWRHPHAPNRDEWGDPARPDYDPIPGIYANAGHDPEAYREYMTTQLTDLLTNYGPIAGIWLDPSLLPQRDTERFSTAFELQALYDEIHDLQPQTLISYKDGVTGTEDFVTPEHGATTDSLDKPGEVCTTMVPGEEYRDQIGARWGYGEESLGERENVATSWGYSKVADGMHRSTEEVWELLRRTRSSGFNLLLNTGLRADGSIDPEDERVLRQVGSRLDKEGFPDEGE